MDLAQISGLVEQVAQEELMPRFNRVKSSLKADGSLITEADTAVQNRLIAELQALWPEIPVLGEEMERPRQQATLGPFGVWTLWTVQPILPLVCPILRCPWPW